MVYLPSLGNSATSRAIAEDGVTGLSPGELHVAAVVQMQDRVQLALQPPAFDVDDQRLMRVTLKARSQHGAALQDAVERYRQFGDFGRQRQFFQMIDADRRRLRDALRRGHAKLVNPRRNVGRQGHVELHLVGRCTRAHDLFGNRHRQQQTRLGQQIRAADGNRRRGAGRPTAQ